MLEYLKLLLEPHVLAVVISLLAVWGATEYVKRWVRETTSTKDDWLPRVIALLIGIAVGSYAWPTDTEVEPWLFGFTIGISAPLLYKLTIVVVRWKWPELAKWMTGSEP